MSTDRNEYDAGVAFNERLDRARATPEFQTLRAAVLQAAVFHYRLGIEHLREQGGISAVMKRAAEHNGAGLTYDAPFGQVGQLSELLDYPAIRTEAQRIARAS